MRFTSEQVSRGHPDKICDQLSDAILTDCLRHDRNSRVAVECLIKNEHITIAGELTSRHQPDYRQLVTEVLSRIGLPNPERYRLHTFLSRQSPDIALGVDRLGAGDQGIIRDLRLLDVDYNLVSAYGHFGKPGLPWEQ